MAAALVEAARRKVNYLELIGELFCLPESLREGSAYRRNTHTEAEIGGRFPLLS